MGRLDIVHTQDELVDESELDNLDELEPVDESLGSVSTGDLDVVLDLVLQGMHPDLLHKNTRQRLEDRLEDFHLKHQIDDYDFKV